MSPLISQLCVVDEQPGYHAMTAIQSLQGESNIGESSGLLFSVYSKAAEDEDSKMVERWQKDADGILIFVSLHLGISLFLHINWNTIDWSILCRSRRPPGRYRLGPQTK
jgi:hypothetical protein